jgi:hypothetical protein
VVDKTRHYYTLCRAATPVDTPIATPSSSPLTTPKKSAKASLYVDDEADAQNSLQWENEIVNEQIF